MVKMMRTLTFLFIVASSAVKKNGVMAFSSPFWSNHNKQSTSRLLPSRKCDSTRNSRQTPKSIIVVPSLLLGSSSSRSRTSSTAVTRSSTTALGMGLTLYGHPGTRSPLVNWGAYEVGLSIEMANDLSQNPHPFRQLPCLTDDDGVVVFESGAILLYLHDLTKLEQQLTPSQAASVLSWITWANASLDPICFLETPEGKVYDTGLKKPNKKMSRLNDILSTQPFLVGDKFTLADVAVASYLLYVVQFFPDINIIDKWPHVHRYMKECVSRPAYAQAFGSNVQNFLIQQLEQTTAANKKGIFGGLL